MPNRIHDIYEPPEDDPHGAVEAHVRLGHPYLKLVGAAAIAALIVGLGIFGSRPQTEPGPAPSAAIAALDATPTPTAAAPATPGITLPPGPFAVSSPNALQTPLGVAHGVGLPSNAGMSLFAAVGTQLVFALNNRLFDDAIATADAASNAPPRIVATARECNMIVALAAADDVVAYVEEAPSGPLNTYTCAGPWKPGFQLFLTDLAGRTPRPVATGEYGSPRLPGRSYQPHVAVGGGLYAFNRPSAKGDGEIVEVRRIGDDRLVFSTPTDQPVVSIGLGAGRLAIVSGVASLTFAVATAAHPGLRIVAHPATGASLSPDGRYLAWDQDDHGARSVVVSEFPPAAAAPLHEVSARDDALPSVPVVADRPAGPLAAWLDTFPGGPDPAPHAVETRLGLVQTPGSPLWMGLDGQALVWVDARNGRPTGAYALELSGDALRVP